VDGVPLADPAAVLFGLADQYVGPWLSTTMSWLIISSLFAGLLAFQNSAARYFYSMGRARVLPKALEGTNRRGAPQPASLFASVITFLVILLFAVRGLDPIVHLFYWFSGVAVVAILLVEALVSIAVVVYFRRTREDNRVWHTIVAPLLAAVALMVGIYLLISRFGLLAGTVVEGHDPAEKAFGLNLTGWILVALPFVMVVVGWLVGVVRRTSENEDAVRDFVS